MGKLERATRQLVALNYPEEEKVFELLNDKGHEFARIQTPRGWRAKGLTNLVPEGKKRLEGNCFFVAFKLAWACPDDFYYCEGFANGLPHAWVGLKYPVTHEASNWCLDLTWPFYTYKNGKKVIHDKIRYTGLRFEAEEVRDFLLTRNARLGEGSTGHAILQYPDEIQHLIKETQ